MGTVAIVALLGAALVWFVQANASDVVERVLGSAGLSVTQRGSAELDLLGGDVLLVDWTMEAPGETPGSRSSIALDTLRVHGFSKTDWFLHRRLVVDDIVLVVDSLAWFGRPVPTTREKPVERRPLRGVELGSARMRVGPVVSRSVGGPRTSITGIAADLKKCSWSPDSVRGSPISGRGTVRTGPWMIDVNEQGPLKVASVLVDVESRSVAVHGIAYGADSTIERDAARLQLEADLITVQVDTVHIAGIAGERGTGPARWNAERIAVSGARIHVARDKRLPDPAFEHVPLTAGLLRLLPLGSSVDSVLFDRVDVTYHERAEDGAVFGRLPFHHIRGSIADLGHFADTTSTVVHAEGFLFDTAYAQLDLRTSSIDSTDRFTARAWLRGMPFADMAPMLAPLTGVHPVGGWLRDIRMTMEGDDRTGRGVVRMRYSDLKLGMGDARDKNVGEVMGSWLLNAVVRKQPREHAERDHEGAFIMERRRDRSVFNMLWRSMRDGAMNIMLPEVMSKKD